MAFGEKAASPSFWDAPQKEKAVNIRSYLRRKPNGDFTVKKGLSIYYLARSETDYSYGNGIFIKPVPKRVMDEVYPAEMAKMCAMRAAAPNFVPRVLGIVFEQGMFVSYALEEVRGITLVNFLSGFGNPDHAESIMRQGDTFFKMIHKKGIHHGDLHGNNIIVTPAGKLKFIDAYIGTRYEKKDRYEWEFIKRLLRRYQRFEGLRGINCSHRIRDRPRPGESLDYYS